MDLHVVLIRERDVLLLERKNTGYADGLYHLPAGHLERDESVIEGAIREAREEIGIELQPRNLRLVHVMHNDAADRVGLFFESRSWTGAVENREPEKCRRLAWFNIENLPARMVPYTRLALQAVFTRSEQLSIWSSSTKDFY